MPTLQNQVVKFNCKHTNWLSHLAVPSYPWPFSQFTVPGMDSHLWSGPQIQWESSGVTSYVLWLLYQWAHLAWNEMAILQYFFLNCLVKFSNEINWARVSLCVCVTLFVCVFVCLWVYVCVCVCLYVSMWVFMVKGSLFWEFVKHISQCIK